MTKFSELLIQRIQSYFKKKYGLDIPDEMANEYLDSLAGLFGIFVEVEQRRRAGPDAQKRRDGTPSADDKVDGDNDSKI